MTKINILVEIIFTGTIELEINYWQLITLNELATVKVNATIRDLLRDQKVSFFGIHVNFHI